MSGSEKGNPAEQREDAARQYAKARQLRTEAAAAERDADERRICEGVTKTGRRCRNDAVSGEPFCIRHLSVEDRSSYARWGRAHRALGEDPEGPR
jgi:hypothetical protein